MSHSFYGRGAAKFRPDDEGAKKGAPVAAPRGSPALSCPHELNDEHKSGQTLPNWGAELLLAGTQFRVERVNWFAARPSASGGWLDDGESPGAK